MSDVYKALIAAQKEFPTIPKNRTGQIGNRNYKYADLSDVLNAVTPVLNKHGLAVSQQGSHDANGQSLVTVLAHESGAVVTSSMLLPRPSDPQEAGSILTYYRRYAVCSIIGVTSEDDTDGSTSKKPGDTKPQQPQSQAGGPAAQKPPGVARPSGGPSPAQFDRLDRLADKAGLTNDELRDMAGRMGIESRKSMTKEQYNLMCNELLTLI